MMQGARGGKSVSFRHEREAIWRELETMIGQAEKQGLAALSTDQLTRLPRVYRGCVSSLSIARSISLDQALLRYLEQLCARGYLLLYGAPPRTRSALADFFRFRLPAAIVSLRWYILVAVFALGLGGVVGYAATSHDIDMYYVFMGEGAQGRTPLSTTAELRGELYDVKPFSDALSAFAAFLFSHNSTVAITAFALGFLLGVPSFVLLFYNGLNLGAFVFLYHSRGLGWDIWGWLLPHGVPELSAIILAGACGMKIGATLFLPRNDSMLAAMRRAGIQVGQVMLGAVFLLLIAGLIEGIIRQTVSDINVRYAMAVAGALLLGAYIWLGARRAARTDALAAQMPGSW
ncbi:MAG: stage II sporulation protein M [Myxococcales bacterium]|nr:stage II sporulation protein M [Myxococcales bacterium]